jgi:amidase
MSGEDRAGQVNRRTAVTLAGGLAATAAVGGVAWMGSASSQPGAADIVMMSAVDLSNAIRTKQVSCVEVMNAYLDHIARINPKVNAIVSLQDRGGLLAQARERDEQLARGEILGWMHGFPHAPKDLLATRGIPTTQGSPIFKDFVPMNDAIVVEREKRAGAIIIGKTNTPEFGLGSHTFNKVFGTTLNPYDQTKTAGGSTGGGAVALALRMLPVVDGTDHGGSLRNPGAYNNVLGLRPSYGRVPSESPDAFTAGSSVNGPMARTAKDLAMLLSVQAGYDPRVPLSNHDDPATFAQPLQRDFKGTRIAWLGDLGGYLTYEPGVLDLCRNALKSFESLGCVVEEARPDYPNDRVWQSFTKLRASQSGPALAELAMDPERRALMKPEAIFEAEVWLKLTTPELREASVVRTQWHQAVRRFMETYEYMLMPSAQLFPFDAKLDWPHEIAGKRMQNYYDWMDGLAQITMSLMPSLNVPVGFNERGLPMGMQIIGRHQADFSCLQLAYAYEQATNWVEMKKPALLNA